MIDVALLHTLRDAALLSDLNDGDLAVLADAMEERSVEEGAAVFIEMMPAKSLYLIRAGAVKLSKILADGEEQTLLVLGPAESFGELALVDGGRRATTARVVEHASLLTLLRPEFEALCERHPRLGVKLLRNILGVLARRMAQSEEDYRELLKFALKGLP